jgi:hypothetical protein
MVTCCSQAAAGQEALEKKVGMLETHQKEIHDALLSMESEAIRLYQVLSRFHLATPQHSRPYSPEASSLNVDAAVCIRVWARDVAIFCE